MTQIYDTGACVYIYFAFFSKGLNDPLRVYSEIEEEAREEILAQGGSLSHHHGVGKLRKHFLPEVVPQITLDWLRNFKQKIDPKNIIASGNLV